MNMTYQYVPESLKTVIRQLRSLERVFIYYYRDRREILHYIDGLFFLLAEI